MGLLTQVQYSILNRWFLFLVLHYFYDKGSLWTYSISKMSEKFCLKWNDFHSNVSKSFGLFRNEDYLHDVTLVSTSPAAAAVRQLERETNNWGSALQYFGINY